MEMLKFCSLLNIFATIIYVIDILPHIYCPWLFCQEIKSLGPCLARKWIYIRVAMDVDGEHRM